MDYKSFYTKDRVPRQYRANIGEHSYGAPRIIDFGEGTTVKIGKYCSIAEGVVIMLGGNHRLDWVTTYPFPALSDRWPGAKGIKGHPKSKGDVIIGNDVWIGTDAMILSGVSIGDGAAIAAMAVVVKDVPPYSIVAGNPAKVIKLRFPDEDIAKLLEICWWDWPEENINQKVHILCDGNVDSFLNHESSAHIATTIVMPPALKNGWFRRIVSKLWP